MNSPFKWIMAKRELNHCNEYIYEYDSKKNYIMHRKVIIPRAVGYLIPRICAGAIFQIEQWAPKVYGKYTRKVIISDKIIYPRSQLAVMQQFLNDFHSWHWHTGCCMPVFSITLLFFPRRGGEVSKMTFMQHWNSIKINTNEMFTSMAAGILSGVGFSSSPGETLGVLRVRRNPPQASLSMHNRFYLNDLCAAQSNGFNMS